MRAGCIFLGVIFSPVEEITTYVDWGRTPISARLPKCTDGVVFCCRSLGHGLNGGHNWGSSNAKQCETIAKPGAIASTVFRLRKFGRTRQGDLGRFDVIGVLRKVCGPRGTNSRLAGNQGIASDSPRVLGDDNRGSADLCHRPGDLQRLCCGASGSRDTFGRADFDGDRSQALPLNSTDTRSSRPGRAARALRGLKCRACRSSAGLVQAFPQRGRSRGRLYAGRAGRAASVLSIGNGAGSFGDLDGRLVGVALAGCLQYLPQNRGALVACLVLVAGRRVWALDLCTLFGQQEEITTGLSQLPCIGGDSTDQGRLGIDLRVSAPKELATHPAPADLGGELVAIVAAFWVSCDSETCGHRAIEDQSHGGQDGREPFEPRHNQGSLYAPLAIGACVGTDATTQLESGRFQTAAIVLVLSFVFTWFSLSRRLAS